MYTAGRRQPVRPAVLRHSDADEIFHSGSDDEYYDNPSERHRQYEIQKQRYLQGRPLNIVTAQLRGPFDKTWGWQNPWLGKSKAKGAPKDTTAGTAPSVQVSALNRLDSAVIQVPNSKSKTATGRQWPSSGADPLTQSSSCHLPSPASSGLGSTASNPFMTSDAWSRVQSWRVDVAAKEAPVEAIHVKAVPAADSPAQITTRGKRPANSELLRNALAKRTRTSGYDRSVGEPLLRTPNHNQTPGTGQGQLLYSTPDNQWLRRSRDAVPVFSGAALDSSVAGQTSISRAAQDHHTWSNESAREKRFFTPPPVVDEEENMNLEPVTPVRRSRPVSDRHLSGAAPLVSGQEQSASHPSSPSIAKNKPPISKLHDNNDVHIAEGTRGSEQFVATTALEAAPPLDFCSQVDRSFQYRSKASRIDKRRALLEATRNAENEEDGGDASISSSSTETASRKTEPPTAANPEHVPENVSKQTEPANSFQEEIVIAPEEEASSSHSSAEDTSLVVAETHDTTITCIDGPTLIPTSSGTSQQQLVAPTTSPPEADASNEGIAIGQGGLAIADLKLTLESDTPPHIFVKIPPTVRPIAIGTAEATAKNHDSQGRHATQQDSDAVVDANVRQGLQPHASPKDERCTQVSPPAEPSSPQQGATVQSASVPEPVAALVLPQQQSPWTKDVTHFKGASPHPWPKLLSQQTPMQETPGCEPTRTPIDSGRAATLTQQSPWAKEPAMPPPIGVVSKNVPSLQAADYTDPLQVTTEGKEISAMTASQNPWLVNGRHEPPYLLRHREVTPPPALHLEATELSSGRAAADGVTIEVSTKAHLPSTPTQQSSLPTPDLTSSIKSFRDFMSPSPEPRRLSKAILSSQAGRVDRSHGRKSALSRSHKARAKRAHLRVSFALQRESPGSSSVAAIDPDETLDGAELPSREAESPSLVRKASCQASHRRASSPPLELSQSELPAEGTRFSKFFRTQARKGPQVRRNKGNRPLLPSASQQTCGSPEVDAMAKAFIEADRACSEQELQVDSAELSGEGGKEGEVPDVDEQRTQEEEMPEVDDVTDVIANLGDYLNSFDVDAELDRARRKDQQREVPQELSMGFPNMHDHMEILGAGVWD